ncbi:hypothetical protein [Haloglycomyces albus]|uniref:hypothetical protein n=1 Tax=Haloglycomyces albus TaxID=526067 RepID=UPI00046D134E|nr:hypothetical protein [Haloglycomyces albus]
MGLEEANSHNQSDQQAVHELTTQLQGTLSTIEDVRTTLESLGVGGDAHLTGEAADRYNDLLSIAAELSQQLEEAGSQLQEAMEPPGSGTNASTGGGNSGDVPFTVTVQSEGDPQIFNEPGPFQKESHNADADSGKSKMRRTMRNMVRNVGDLKKAVNDHGTSMESTVKHNPTTGERGTLVDTTPAPQNPSTVQPPLNAFNPVDATVHLVILGIGVVEAASRARKKDSDS